ncbi:MAG: tripartite tricarboxylate transporter substrate-binding protein [Hyphomicrobiales bacterium]
MGIGAAALSAGMARAADWPTRPVTVVVPYSPGGNTDMMARLASQYLADKFGQPFVIENRSGGGGSVGAIAVARAQPDGYTLLFGASTQIINIPMLQKVSYDPQKDLVPISIFGAGPCFWAHRGRRMPSAKRAWSRAEAPVTQTGRHRFAPSNCFNISPAP